MPRSLRRTEKHRDPGHGAGETVETNGIHCGDALTVLRTLPDESVQCCITSPPYWNLRDYGIDGQLGLEKTPDEYVAKMVEVFREVRRVLRSDGTLWLNLGSSYAGGGNNRGNNSPLSDKQASNAGATGQCSEHIKNLDPALIGFKAKDMIPIPWMVALALQADGWYLRQDIIWHKPNPMPESVKDRCTKAHEYVFLMAKSERYYYDAEAIKERTHGPREDRNGFRGELDGPSHYVNQPALPENGERFSKPPTDNWNGSQFHTGKTGEHQLGRSQKVRKPAGWDTGNGAHGSIHRDGRAPEVEYESIDATSRNRRSVWTVPTFAFPDAHFATFPPDLIKPMVMAGSRVGDVVLDPFMGAGTVALVAKELGRDYIGIELKQEYIDMANRRLRQEVLRLA